MSETENGSVPAQEEKPLPGAWPSGASVAHGLGASLFCGLAWAGLVITSGYTLGYMGWILGAVAAAAMLRATENRGARVAAMAVCITLAGMLLCKAIVLQWGLDSLAERRIPNDPLGLAAALIWDLHRQGKISEHDYALICAKKVDRENPRVQALAERLQTIAANMTFEHKQDLARRFVQARLPLKSFGQRVKETVSWTDLVWALLATGTAAFMGMKRTSI